MKTTSAFFLLCLCTTALPRALLAEPAEWGWEDGGGMIRSCEAMLEPVFDPEQYARAGFCMGMILGISDMMRTNCSIESAFSFLKADPQGKLTTHAQMVVNYARDHPEEWEMGGTTLVMSAMNEHYPCE